MSVAVVAEGSFGDRGRLRPPPTVCNPEDEIVSTLTRRSLGIALTALLAVRLSGALADSPAQQAALPDDRIEALALRLYAQMEAGKIDRTQFTEQYSAQLTDDAVKAMSHQLGEYGAPPLGAQVLRTRTTSDQTLYLVKLLFPRGDAAAMLIGLDAAVKITGVDIVSMAGD